MVVLKGRVVCSDTSVAAGLLPGGLTDCLQFSPMCRVGTTSRNDDLTVGHGEYMVFRREFIGPQDGKALPV